MEKFKKFCQDHAPEIALGTYVGAVVGVCGFIIYRASGAELVSVVTKDDVLKSVTEHTFKSGKTVTYVTERTPELVATFSKAAKKSS